MVVVERDKGPLFGLRGSSRLAHLPRHPRSMCRCGRASVDGVESLPRLPARSAVDTPESPATRTVVPRGTERFATAAGGRVRRVPGHTRTRRQRARRAPAPAAASLAASRPRRGRSLTHTHSRVCRAEALTAIPGVDGFFRGIRGGIWRDMAGYGGRYREIPGDTGRYQEIRDTGRYGQIRADTGRYGEMRGDARRYGEIQSDIGEIHQDTAKKPSTLGLAAVRKGRGSGSTSLH